MAEIIQATQLPAPNIRFVSDEEKEKINDRIGILLESGDDAALARMVEEYPISAQTLDRLKRCYGMGFLLRYKFNLVNAIKEYGEKWLEG